MGHAAVFVALVLAAAAIYALLCAIWPYTNCRRCHGTGTRPAPIGGGFRHCPACHHTGEQLRLGRRLYQLTRHTRRARRTNGKDNR